MMINIMTEEQWLFEFVSSDSYISDNNISVSYICGIVILIVLYCCMSMDNTNICHCHRHCRLSLISINNVSGKTAAV